MTLLSVFIKDFVIYSRDFEEQRKKTVKQERDVPSRHIPFLTKYKPVWTGFSFIIVLKQPQYSIDNCSNSILSSQSV